MFIADALTKAIEYLQSFPIQFPELSARHLLANVLSLSHLDLIFHEKNRLSSKQEKDFFSLVDRRAFGEPLDYIIGGKTFLGCKLFLSSDVLIPRAETELLVEHIYKYIKKNGKIQKVLDLCCGSGAIAIALKKKFPHLEIVASDIDSKALEIARINGVENNVQVHFCQSDLFANIDNDFDLIVSNPPYIPVCEYEILSEEVREFEPRLALLGGEDGLVFYRKISTALVHFPSLKALFLEMGYNQGNSIKKIFKKKRALMGEVILDWSGHDRFFFLEFE